MSEESQAKPVRLRHHVKYDRTWTELHIVVVCATTRFVASCERYAVDVMENGILLVRRIEDHLPIRAFNSWDEFHYEFYSAGNWVVDEDPKVVET